MKRLVVLLTLIFLLPPITSRALLQDDATPVPYAGTPVLTTNGVEILYYFFVKGPSDDVTRFYGEFRNTTKSTILQPPITITLYDENDKIVDTGKAVHLPYIDIIAPGATMPIVMNVEIEMGTWAREEITIGDVREPSSRDLEHIAQGLVPQDLNVTEKDDTSIRLLGKFYNGDKQVAQNGRIYLVIYDSAGKVTGFDGFARFDDAIHPGESTPFEIEVNDIAVEGGWTYRLFWGGQS